MFGCKINFVKHFIENSLRTFSLDDPIFSDFSESFPAFYINLLRVSLFYWHKDSFSSNTVAFYFITLT